MKRILVVDDEQNIRMMLKRVLSGSGYEVEEAANGEEALKKIDHGRYEAMLVDLKMPKMNGLQMISKIKENNILIPIVMMSAYGSIPDAVEAMKLGARDYLVKPFDLDELKIILHRIIRQDELFKENQYYKEEEDRRFNFREIIGQSKAIKGVLDMIKKVASLSTTVMITGESGTGKELIARAIHKNSPREDRPFVVANCVAYSSNILESELFGHEKGSFTGANNRRIGRFEIANNGTIFLDEIAELNFSSQAKLLRVVQEKEFERVGSSALIKVDARIISATNKDLEVEINNNRFREDLFYRLNVFRITVPPLRERRDDIPLLLKHFIRKYNQILKKAISHFSNGALYLLMDYDFPGNIRELENIVERAMIMSNQKVIGPDSLYFPNENNSVKKIATLKDMEKEMIEKHLIMNNGNRTITARSLGISRRSLQLKIREYQINL